MICLSNGSIFMVKLYLCMAFSYKDIRTFINYFIRK